MAEAVTALIAEDEPLLQEELADALKQLWPELVIAGFAANGVEALRLLALIRPRILFLDIKMPGVSGIDIAKQVAGNSHVVFVTAYDRFAAAAFDEGAIDYVVKPISLQRLATTVRRLQERIAQAPADISGVLAELARQRSEPRTFLRWINASVGNTIKLITVDEICYFRADSKYTLVATPGSELLIRKSLRDLNDQLDPDVFWQIHRSTIVNVNAIASVVRDLRGRLQVKLKQRPELLPIAESSQHLFREM